MEGVSEFGSYKAEFDGGYYGKRNSTERYKKSCGI